MRGEDGSALVGVTSHVETPPRAWGRHKSTFTEIVEKGNNPTCVGKTLDMDGDACLDEKHPHVRGEDAFSLLLKKILLETPPRAWGRHGHRLAIIPFYRNTPTCVGKTKRGTPAERGYEKHPHVRGEDTITSYSKTPSRETPPRAWGRPP